jgi:hypothetical protein
MFGNTWFMKTQSLLQPRGLWRLKVFCNHVVYEDSKTSATTGFMKTQSLLQPHGLWRLKVFCNHVVYEDSKVFCNMVYEDSKSSATTWFMKTQKSSAITWFMKTQKSLQPHGLWRLKVFCNHVVYEDSKVFCNHMVYEDSVFCNHVVYEDSKSSATTWFMKTQSLLRCYTESTGKWRVTFQRRILHPPSRTSSPWTVSNCLPVNAA